MPNRTPHNAYDDDFDLDESGTVFEHAGGIIAILLATPLFLVAIAWLCS